MLRPYQVAAIRQVKEGWSKNRNHLLVLPTGAGKTFTFSTIINDLNLPTMVMAHRQELVSQMSLALGSMGVAHRLICNDDTLTQIVRAHRMVLGKVWFDPTAPTACAGVDTLIRRKGNPLFNNIKLWVIDEAHHLVRGNKWHEASEMFPNARGLGVTATPIRADGKGLGRHADGVFDALIEGPTGKELIDMGYLSPYQCAVCKPDDLDLTHVEHGSDGDFKQNQLRVATKASRKLVGSVVGEYLRRANGKLGITFCVDIEQAQEITAKYQEAGVPAALVTGKSGIVERAVTLDKFRRRQLLQLVNVDLFGEGFDVPGVEVVSMARRTDSFALFSQQFGRALRPVYQEGMPQNTDDQRKQAIAYGPKPKALIIDHVGNIIHHKLPTSRRAWTLDRREKRAKGEKLDKEDKLAVCCNMSCAMPYQAFLIKCPFCGTAPPAPASRARTIEEVDGDLVLLDETVLAEMHQESERVIGLPHTPRGLPNHAIMAIIKRHGERAKAQTELREAISQWGGLQTHQRGLELREAQKLFYLTFGVDVLTAQTLGAKEATELKERVVACS